MNRIPFVLFLTLAPSLALAAPEVAVVGAHVPGLSAQDAVDAAASLVGALERDGTIGALSPDDFAERIAGREELVLQEAAFRRGRAALAEADALAKRAEFEEAIPLYERAIDRLGGGVPLTGDPSELTEARLQLGLAYANLGEADSARAAWADVVAVNPDFELDPINYPPKITEIYASVRQELLDAGTGEIALNLDRDASLFLDGRAVEDRRLPGLTPGEHHLFAVGEGGERAYAAVTVEPGQTAAVRMDLGPGQLGVSDESVRRALQIQELYRALGQYGDTDLLLVAGVQDDGAVSVCLYSSRTETFSKALSAAGGADPVAEMLTLAPTLAGYVTESGGIRPDRVSPQVPALGPSDNPLLSAMLLDPSEPAPIDPGGDPGAGEDDEGGARWALWAGLGVAAAGGAGAAAYLATRPQDAGTVVFGPIP